MRTALIAGASGLVGSELLQLLLQDDEYGQVIAVTRTPLDVRHGKLKNIVVDFNALDRHADELAADDIFCCLGTTMKKARTKEAFRKVDHDYPASLAKVTHAAGATQFLLVSALGADASSSIFYNQVKGETEQTISTVPFSSYHIFRPSLLLGPRGESRPGEDAAKAFYWVFNIFIPSKYKGIEAVRVARAMLHFAKQRTQGKFVHSSKEMQSF